MLIHLVDDDLTVLDAARFLLEQAGYQVETWSNSQAFVNKASLFEPGVVLLDMKMPLLDGHQVHQFLCQQQSTLAVVIMTAHADVPMAVQELKQGAVDFLQKPVQFSQLQSVLKTAIQTTQSRYERYKIRHCYAQLSRKELDILELLIQGYINRQIAESLNISVRTVEVHRSHIMEKMQAQTIAELIYKTAQL
ncbi:response regulator transcription factor [Pasteurella multocida]|uniref:response regulator transcription factor n=1 Tax=Pasteurella multocida TaxID=747 RepID=UPI00202433AB|nr:response regulator transcription factor [Pasteurella multocida]MDT8767611.1 response regulator transcription factor [Pasteurella multocida]URJ87392.1 response regulator transcription factor [Pasteurella multocida]URJ89382.1 response regulator transcription factor [Pasteurella multocida]HDR0618620.1 response regulator transcription factor [Pasteurella multocida]HEP1081586.1 response regulator transcription factor [Pasteurella multocida]